MTNANGCHRTTLSSQNNLNKITQIWSHMQPRVIVGPAVAPWVRVPHGPTIHSHVATWAPPPHGPTRQNRWATQVGSVVWPRGNTRQHDPTTVVPLPCGNVGLRSLGPAGQNWWATSPGVNIGLGFFPLFRNCGPPAPGAFGRPFRSRQQPAQVSRTCLSPKLNPERRATP
jgi:hypothetical protein